MPSNPQLISDRAPVPHPNRRSDSARNPIADVRSTREKATQLPPGGHLPPSKNVTSGVSLPGVGLPAGRERAGEPRFVATRSQPKEAPGWHLKEETATLKATSGFLQTRDVWSLHSHPVNPSYTTTRNQGFCLALPVWVPCEDLATSWFSLDALGKGIQKQRKQNEPFRTSRPPV